MNTNTLTDPPVLVPRVPARRLGGMGTLLRRELGAWWHTRTWWVQSLVWLVILDVVSLLNMLDPAVAGAALPVEAVEPLFLGGATLIGIGAVVKVQGAIVGEKELGTAAWVLTKPVERRSFVLAKFLAYAFGFLVVAVAVPTVVFAIEAQLLLETSLSPLALAAAAPVTALAVLFYVSLTLALGTVAGSRGPVAGIGIGMLLAGLFLKGLLPPIALYATPWLLGEVAASIAVGEVTNPNWWVPIVTTIVTSTALLALAIRRFDRDEF